MHTAGSCRAETLLKLLQKMTSICETHSTHDINIRMHDTVRKLLLDSMPLRLGDYWVLLEVRSEFLNARLQFCSHSLSDVSLRDVRGDSYRHDKFVTTAHDEERERVTYTNMAKKTDGKDTTHVNLATRVPCSQWPVARQDLLFSTEL
jgi:hypothetical protein